MARENFISSGLSARFTAIKRTALPGMCAAHLKGTLRPERVVALLPLFIKETFHL